MSILFDLPTDVSLSILMDWVGDTKSLVALDSASARSIRWAYLGLVRDPAFVVSKEIIFGEDESIVSDIRHWISSRGVKLRAIQVNTAAMTEVIKIDKECLSTVTSLTLASDDTEKVDLDSFRALLGLLPSLTSLDMKELSSDDEDHLVVLSTMHHLSLRSLVLENDCTCKSIGLLVSAFGSSLEVLDAQSVDTDTLHLLGSSCSNLKQFAFMYHDISPETLASALGPGKFPMLEKIFILYSSPSLTDDTITVLCSSHPNLESIVIQDGGYKITLSSVGIALTCCPQFRELSTACFKFNTVSTAADAEQFSAEHELPFYHLELHRGLQTANLGAAFQAIAGGAPFYNHKLSVIWSYAGCFESVYKFSDDGLQQLMDCFGEDLHVLGIGIGSDVSELTLERFCRTCTQLRTLHLLSGSERFDDELVMLLADHCHFLNYLSLAGAYNVRNVSMCYFLQRLGPQLKVLMLYDCYCLDDTTLITIDAHCKQLQFLTITRTRMTADAVITHLVKPNRKLKFKLKLENFRADDKVMERLKAFVRKEEKPTEDVVDAAVTLTPSPATLPALTPPASTVPSPYFCVIS